MRRLRLVLAALAHLTKAEIASLREGPHLPGGTVLHDLVYGHAVDASLEPEWLVITDGQQPGHWRLLHNSSGPGQRCSVGSSLRYQPSPSTREQRSAQGYTFEALHRVYFYDAWRVPQNPNWSCHLNQAYWSMAVTGLDQVWHLMSSRSLIVTQTKRNIKCKKTNHCPLWRLQMLRWLMTT